MGVFGARYSVLGDHLKIKEPYPCKHIYLDATISPDL